jgi:hypothetical protein
MNVEYSIVDNAKNGCYDKKPSDDILSRYRTQLGKAFIGCDVIPTRQMKIKALDDRHVYKKWVLYKLMPRIYPLLVVAPLLSIVYAVFLWAISPYVGLVATHWQFGKGSEFTFVAFMCISMVPMLFFAVLWIYLVCKDNIFGYVLSPVEILLFRQLLESNKTVAKRPINSTFGSYGDRPKRLFNMTSKETEEIDYSVHAPPYVAITHAWPENDNYKKTISVAGCYWPVPVLETREDICNLVDTVTNKVELNSINYLWIDVLCVPQYKNEHKERDEEIPSLGDYYRNADMCFAFIGGVKHVYLKWNEFLDDRWYKRVWTLQEACLNENTYIVANIRDSPMCFMRRLGTIDDSIFVHIDDFTSALMNSDFVQYGRAAVLQAYAFQHVRGTIKTHNYEHNLLGLDMLANRRYTHEKDKIFGVAGLASLPLTVENCTVDLSLTGAIEVLLKSLNGKDVAGTLGLCNMTTAEWIYRTIAVKHAQRYSWIMGFGEGNMGFAGSSGKCKIIDGSLHGEFFVCPVCPLYWFRISDVRCTLSAFNYSSGKTIETLLRSIFEFGIIIALSTLFFKMNYKIVVSLLAARYVLSAMLIVLVAGFFIFSTSNGAMLDTDGKVVGIFHCKNKILNLSKKLVLVINCDGVDHRGLVAGNICYVVGGKTFSALYGVNIIMLQRSDIERYPVIDGIIQ